MKKVRITLLDTLDKYNLTANKLSVESKVRSATIYNILNGEVKSITFNTLEAIVNTLIELTGDDNINVNDIFTFVSD